MKARAPAGSGSAAMKASISLGCRLDILRILYHSAAPAGTQRPALAPCSVCFLRIIEKESERRQRSIAIVSVFLDTGALSRIFNPYYKGLPANVFTTCMYLTRLKMKLVKTWQFKFYICYITEFELPRFDE